MKPNAQGKAASTRRRLAFALTGLGLAAVIVAAVLVYLFTGAPGSTGSTSATKEIVPTKSLAVATPTFVGSKSCASCHSTEYNAWLGSHHQLAMQPATAGSVLGNFDHVSFHDGDAVSTFSRDGKKFMVRTTGPDGKLHDYTIQYTFGLDPLQQYLIALPGGRLQAFDIAWNSRPAGAGGQRWFALYPGNNGNPASPLNWTAHDQTWNYMCAACHSTDLQKNYDAKNRTYATTYSEVSVGCEACHGPGSNHVTWAKAPKAHPELAANKGLTIHFDGDKNASWSFDGKDGVVRRSTPRTNEREIETCARCHSLRQPIHTDYVHGQPIGDDFDVSLLTPEYYFPDGQIKGEVFEYGSFIQSRMYHAGVTCSNCHNPHTTKLRATGNQLCTSCHVAKRYDTSRHTHHPVASEGAKCVACHMPTRTYMRVDARRDHSLRIPRPDLSEKLGTPNACNQCHKDETPQWAAQHIEKWFGPEHDGFQHFAKALQAGREGSADAGRLLTQLIRNTDQPAIARATALHLLALHGYPHPAGLIEKTATDDSELVRRAGAGLLDDANLKRHLRTIAKLLDDPVRAVRIKTADALAGVQAAMLPATTASALKQASKEYVAARKLNAERPEAHLNLATFYRRQHDFARAESELQTALKLDPSFGPAAVNLADLYRSRGEDDKAQAVLNRTLAHAPDDPALLFSLALLKVRQHNRGEALTLLAKAVAAAPDNVRYSYVYAIALYDTGKTHAAIHTLEAALEDHPDNRNLLSALVNFYTREGNADMARKYRQRLNQGSQ